MNPTKVIGIQPDRYCVPLVEALRSTGRFELAFDVPGRNAIRLRDRSAGIAFVSPIDYARDGSLFRIVPDLAVASSGASHIVTLHFKTGLQNISTLAVDPACPSEAVLARILLAEEFDTAPSLVPVIADLDKMLTRADAALLVGDASWNAPESHSLDLIELWSEMTGGLPFVHGILCCHEGALSAEEVSLLSTVHGAAQRLHEQRSSTDVTVRPEGGISFTFDDAAQAGFTELMTYAFYHGILPDVPELNFYSLDQGDEDATDEPRATPLSSN